MGYRSWLQNYVNNHPDQNTRSQGQALLNVVGDDMGIDRNFLSGNVGNGGNFRKTGWFGNHTWVKGGNGALYKNDEIRGLVSRREELKREVAEYEGIKQLQSSINENRITPEQLEAAGLDPQDAAIQALLYNQELDQQQSQVNEISANIADLQYNMSLDRVELLKDYPVFDETSPEYNADFTKKAADMYVSAANLQFNEEGAPISADKKLYEFMTDLYGIYEEGLKAGDKKISRAKQSAAVMNAGGISVSGEVDEKQFVNGFFN